MSEVQTYKLPLKEDGLVSWDEFKRAIDIFIRANGLSDEEVRLGINGGPHSRIRSSMVFSLHPLTSKETELRMTPFHEVIPYTSA